MPKPELTAQEKKILKEAFLKAFGENGSAKREQVVKEMCESIGRMLGQEYRVYKGVWWLFTLGKAARPLTSEEIQEHSLTQPSPRK